MKVGKLGSHITHVVVANASSSCSAWQPWLKNSIELLSCDNTMPSSGAMICLTVWWFHLGKEGIGCYCVVVFVLRMWLILSVFMQKKCLDA